MRTKPQCSNETPISKDNADNAHTDNASTIQIFPGLPMTLQGFQVAYEPCQDYGGRGGDILDSSSKVRLQYLLGPGSLDEVRVDDLVPALLTLHVAAVREVLGDQLPALVELLHLLLQ